MFRKHVEQPFQQLDLLLRILAGVVDVRVVHRHRRVSASAMGWIMLRVAVTAVAAVS